MLKRPCHFFNTTGKCRFGKHCKFLHSLDISQEQISSDNQKDGILKSVSTVAVSQVRGNQESSHNQDKIQDEGLSTDQVSITPEVPRSLCKFFSVGKFCRYGNRCRYSHNIPVEDEIKERDDLKGSSEIDGKSQDEDATNQVQDEVCEAGISPTKSHCANVGKGKAQQKLCNFFNRGYCRFGSRCRFYHPKPNEENVEQQTAPSEAKKTECDQAEVNSEEWKRVVKPTRIMNVFQANEITEEKKKELRETEIRQFKRRFPADKLTTVSDTEENAKFVFTFSPTDPDWPFDVKIFDIQVEFGQEYPMKIFKVSMPVEQDLPATVLRYIEVSIQEWVKKKEEDNLKKGIVELLFRPFLRWMDRNMESIVTQGLKQLQRELRAQAAGLEFIPAKELKRGVTTESLDYSDMPLDSIEKDDRRPVVYRKGDFTDETYEVPEHNSSDDVDSSDDDDVNDENEENGGNIENDTVHTRPIIDPDTARTGTEVSLKNMQIWYLTTMLMEKLKLVVQCERCKNKTDFSTPPNRVNSVACSKCNNVQLVAFRPVLAHGYSSTMGYLDMDGCSAFDVILQDCHLSIGCIKCNRDVLVKKFTAGKLTETWCRGCHSKMKFSCDSVKLSLLTADGIDKSKFSGHVHTVNVRRNVRLLKDPAIKEGLPLPNNGACKHYKKSFRWLRFPCCGKTYPCDICHDDKEDHEMKFANRMICGFCCKEQVR
ncbi:hypothetical protein ACF0H5_013099 [Mactra antiquata]